MATRIPVKPAFQAGQQPPETFEEVRKNVREMLLRSQSFRELPPDQQVRIAHDTVEVASYLCDPEGLTSERRAKGLDPHPLVPPDPYGMRLAQAQAQPSGTIQQAGATPAFSAVAAREGAAVAGAYLQAVNFPNFVAGLIKGVFHAIVESSIEQMQAYADLVANVSKTLNEFRDENVSDNAGKDHLIDQFPDLFALGTGEDTDGNPVPKVQLKNGVDESAALARVKSLPVEGGISSLDDDSIEQKLVPAARTQLATSRQQLLATLVLMGINRIVVTDGKIAAKVLFDFKAQDRFKLHSKAVQFDYAKGQTRTVQEGEIDSQSQGATHRRSHDKDSTDDEDRDASFYLKGKYKTTTEPVLTLQSVTEASQNADLSTKASLSGTVDVNFKSDVVSLDKLADSFQIGRIQDAAKPRSTQPARGSAPAGSTTTPGPAPVPAPAAAPARP